VQVRFQGPDYGVLRLLAGKAQQILEEDGGAKGVRNDWRQPEKVIRPDFLELQALRNGISRADVAEALETKFEGRVVGFYREPGSAGTGVYPQETRLLPIIARLLLSPGTLARFKACKSGATRLGR
jgi:multidrug efflux pump subunit AcrB